MEQIPLSFTSSSTDDIQGGSHPLRKFEYEAAINKEEDENLLKLLSWSDIYSSCTKNNPPLLPPPSPQPSASNGCLLDNYLSNNAKLFTGSIQETKVLKQHHTSDLDSLDLLRNYECGFTKAKGKTETNDESPKLSTDAIIRMSGERFIACKLQGIDHSLVYMHRYNSSFSSLSIEELRDVDLGHFLLAAAEKVGYKQFERADTMLAQCERLASNKGNPVQRVVYYLVQALRERIGRETGRIVAKRIDEKEKHGLLPMSTNTNLVFLKFHLEIPFNQVTVFTGTQAILEIVKNKRNIHLIDFQIRSGVQWTTFIQALAERSSRPVQRLRITVIALNDRQKVKQTCKSLETFAMSLNLPFSYSVIFLSDMQDLQKGHFVIKPQEAVVVYCPMILRTMISRPNCLENTMEVIKSLNPSIMVVTEVEANLNSPSFFNRFVETFFFYSAYFDCLEDFTDRDNHYRGVLERIFFGDGIYNIVAAEGEERFTRSVKKNVWETFFQRFRLVPLEISDSSLYQAKLLMDRFSCASSCDLEKKGNCLTVGWKKTPIQTVSIWKFY